MLPIESLAVRFATTGKKMHRRNLLKTSKTVDMYNRCPVLKDLHFNQISVAFAADVLILELLLRFRSHSLPSPSDAVHSERNHVVQVSSLSFF